MIFFGKIKDLALKFSNQREWLDFAEKNDDKNVSISIEKEKGIRTLKQNDSLHLYYELLATALNDAGLDMKKVLKPHVNISWNKENIKTYLWKPLQKAITGKESTKELDKVSEITEIYEHLNRHLSEKFGVSVPFPKKEEDEFDIQSVAYPENNLGEVKF